ncbi:MAG: Rhomboid family protein [Pedosphaera sp.]|nr:Rhomboid family protein [Pedosphaera sp.]
MGNDFKSVFTILTIAVTVNCSILGFKSSAFVERFIFCPAYILRDKQYYRLFTSGFLHADWLHLLFNMYSLYAFGRNLELFIGPTKFLTIYFASIIGGNSLSLFLHRHHVYRAYGASGGVCGILFASIFLLPGGEVGLFLLPFSMPAWLYAILFILSSFYGIRNKNDNIGHDAHFGGAIIGLLVTTAFYPQIVRYSLYLYLTVLLLSVLILIYLVKNPLFLPLSSFLQSRPSQEMPSAKSKLTREQETHRVNALLDKISQSGMQSLTKEEHNFLLKASRTNKR